MELKRPVNLVITAANSDWPSNQNAYQVLTVLTLLTRKFVNQDIFPRQKQQNVLNVKPALRQVFQKVPIFLIHYNIYFFNVNRFENNSKCENHGTSSPETCTAGYECSNPAAPTMCLVWFWIGLHTACNIPPVWYRYIPKTFIYHLGFTTREAFLKPK